MHHSPPPQPAGALAALLGASPIGCGQSACLLLAAELNVGHAPVPALRTLVGDGLHESGHGVRTITPIAIGLVQVSPVLGVRARAPPLIDLTALLLDLIELGVGDAGPHHVPAQLDPVGELAPHRFLVLAFHRLPLPPESLVLRPVPLA